MRISVLSDVHSWIYSDGCCGVIEFTPLVLKIYSTLAVAVNTYGDKKLHTLLVKYFNDLLDGQKSERSIDKVTYFYIGDLFCIHLGTVRPNRLTRFHALISALL